MDTKSIQSSLCKGLRACGLRKEETQELVNTVMKWYTSSGPVWTVNRLKDYVLWYETHLAGDPAPPPWFSKNSSNLPNGIFGRVFKLKNPAKVLGVLSCHTVFKAKEILSCQREKFLDGLAAKGQRPDPEILGKYREGKIARLPKLRITSPPLDAISGFSIPISPEEGKVYVNSPEERILAYCDSWANVPLPTLRYLRRERVLEQVPPGLLSDLGTDGLYSILPDQERIAGFVGCIQEPSLKARWIANPNRISQHYLTPLGEHWYSILRKLPTDCTYNQTSGVDWVQNQLKSGMTLSGADLSSATDLLDRAMCLELVTKCYLGRSCHKQEHWVDPVEQSYKSAIDHFMDLCAMEWVYPEGGTVRWSQGQPLGTFPSFALLGLTNNALGRMACHHAGIPPDSFRVIGDDIIMDSRALSHYTDLVESFGGKINHQKSLTSSCVAEFAGRIILPDRSFNKTIKYKEPSDNSFMEIVSNLGDQAKGILRPRQRKQYDKFKFVPGIIVNGPFPTNSFGFPLEIRYTWYLLHSGLTKERVIPDKEVYDSWQFASKVYYTLAEKGRTQDFEYSVPFSFADDFQSSLASAVVKKGNPMLKNGKTALEVLESVSSPDSWVAFQDYIAILQTESKSRSLER